MPLPFYLGHVHGPGQEVGGHVADEHHAAGLGEEVVLHAVHSLVGAEVDVGRIRVQGPAARLGDPWGGAARPDRRWLQTTNCLFG